MMSRAACVGFVQQTRSTGRGPRAAGRGCFPRAWAACVVEQRWVDSVHEQLQLSAGASSGSLVSPADMQHRRRQRQFAYGRQPPQPWLRATFTADVDMDVDEGIVVMEDSSVPPASAPLQLPSGMVLRARSRGPA